MTPLNRNHCLIFSDFSNDTLFYRDKVILAINRVVNQGEVSRVLTVFWYRKAGIVASSNKVICDIVDILQQQLLLFIIDTREDSSIKMIFGASGLLIFFSSSSKTIKSGSRIARLLCPSEKALSLRSVIFSGASPAWRRKLMLNLYHFL